VILTSAWRQHYNSVTFEMVVKEVCLARHFDGRLIFVSYQRPCLYSAATVTDVFGSVDYQHIANPAYNEDRGPVDLFGARLHIAF
jgi:hypothetical protein